MEERELKDIEPTYCKYYIDHEGNMVIESSYHITQDNTTDEEKKDWFHKSFAEFKRRIALFNEKQEQK